jgi:hypothetical protein
MKIYVNPGVTLGLLLFTLLASQCSDPKKSNDVSKVNSYLAELVETRMGESEFYISIPEDYWISKREGPDFVIYYLNSKDTTATPDFTAGLYFGDHPSEFEWEEDSCKMENLEREILGKDEDWALYNCKGRYSIQTIISSGSGAGWDSYVHAFGGANSTAALEKLFTIFSTMKRKA